MTVAEARARYTVTLWDKASPINGVPAEQVLQSHAVPPNGSVYLIYRDGNLLYFQPHAPWVAGLVPMTDSEALQYADEQVLQLACAELPISAAASPNPAAVNTTVTVTATLPVDTPDTSVTFQAEGGTAYREPVSNGQASHMFAFAALGIYHVTASSAHHGKTTVEVVVS